MAQASVNREGGTIWEKPELKKALKIVLKYEIQSLLQRLAQTGEESVVITASTADGTATLLGSKRGKGFAENVSNEDVKRRFISYINAGGVSQGPFSPSGSEHSSGAHFSQLPQGLGSPETFNNVVVKSEPMDTFPGEYTMPQQHQPHHTRPSQPKKMPAKRSQGAKNKGKQPVKKKADVGHPYPRTAEFQSQPYQRTTGSQKLIQLAVKKTYSSGSPQGSRRTRTVFHKNENTSKYNAGSRVDVQEVIKTHLRHFLSHKNPQPGEIESAGQTCSVGQDTNTSMFMGISEDEKPQSGVETKPGELEYGTKLLELGETQSQEIGNVITSSECSWDQTFSMTEEEDVAGESTYAACKWETKADDKNFTIPEGISLDSRGLGHSTADDEHVTRNSLQNTSDDFTQEMLNEAGSAEYTSASESEVVPYELLTKGFLKCLVCDTIMIRTSFRRHKLIHQGVAQYRCPICGRYFNQNGNLQRHIRAHSEHRSRDFVCPCGKTFLHKNHLVTHTETCDTGKSLLPSGREKIFKCPNCAKRYKKIESLYDHVKSHDQDKSKPE